MRDELALKFGPMIRGFRESLGLTQADFASKIEMNLRTYQNIEAGKTTRMNLTNMVKLIGLGFEPMALTEVMHVNSSRPPHEMLAGYDDLGHLPEDNPPQPQPVLPQGYESNSLVEAFLKAGAIHFGFPYNPKGDPQVDLDLSLLEFQAWARRTVGRDPDSLLKIERGLRNLINEIEGVTKPNK